MPPIITKKHCICYSALTKKCHCCWRGQVYFHFREKCKCKLAAFYTNKFTEFFCWAVVPITFWAMKNCRIELLWKICLQYQVINVNIKAAENAINWKKTVRILTLYLPGLYTSHQHEESSQYFPLKTGHHLYRKTINNIT